ncbi:hypothetical protein BGZ65_006855 [Modicella reniformis]|uniref:Uncharacterized protein n=1 Tax=Modicella reniformis TaxID=1440133 RepID=A0A9P6SSZ2_9FUNG|nr:hypothetical protein BGZ65_006855 [Modicella reniformis]
MDMYKMHLNLYKKFCEDNYADQKAFRFDVTPAKAILFFEKVMFHRTSKKYFYKRQYKDIKTAVRLPSGFENQVHRNRVDLADGVCL